MAVMAGDEPPLVVDAGAGFLPFEAFGVAYEVPDFAALLQEGPAAALITHAHDDHMKGLARLVAGREFAPGEVLAGVEGGATGKGGAS
jgi:glyoxylase-like metal-dependent hydrolase (beta-lactamase superfamily II)